MAHLKSSWLWLAADHETTRAKSIFHGQNVFSFLSCNYLVRKLLKNQLPTIAPAIRLFFFLEEGSSACIERPPCTSKDFFQIHTPCDKEGKVSEKPDIIYNLILLSVMSRFENKVF